MHIGCTAENYICWTRFDTVICVIFGDILLSCTVPSKVLSFSFGAEQPSDESTQYPQGIQPCNSSVFYQKHRTYFKISCGGRHEVDDTLLLFSLLCLSSKERSVPPFQVWHLTGKQFSNMALETSIHNWGNSQVECLIWHLQYAIQHSFMSLLLCMDLHLFFLKVWNFFCHFQQGTVHLTPALRSESSRAHY